MATVTWSELSSQSSDFGTAFNSKSNGTTTLIDNINNSTGKALYLEIQLQLAVVTFTGSPSLTLALRRLFTGHAANAIETFVVALTQGQTDYHATMRLPNAATYGLFWTNNSGTTTAASGNGLWYRTWGEDVS